MGGIGFGGWVGGSNNSKMVGAPPMPSPHYEKPCFDASKDFTKSIQ